MPDAFRKAAFTSSSAFFIEAAANTVIDLSFAAAGNVPARPIAIQAMRKCRRKVMAVFHPAGALSGPPACRGLEVPQEPPFRDWRARGQRALCRRHPSDPFCRVK